MDDRVAIVTGASRGIGHAIALALGRAAFHVVAMARTRAPLDALVEQIEADGGKALAVVGDVTDPEQVDASVQQALDHFGRVDVLVNNAGVAHVKSIEETTLDDWRASIEVNLSGSFLMSRAVWPVMVQQGGGTIVNMSSVLGKRPGPNRSAYCAAKYGVIGLTESLAREGYGQNVRVNAICPGEVETDLFRSLHPDFPAEDVLAPADVADMVVFLAGPGAAHVNGESIVMRKM